MSAEQGVDLASLDIEDLLDIFIGVLSGKALEHMGVPIKEEEEEEPEKDLRRASVAINSMSCLVDQLEPLVSEEAAKQYRSLVGDLQLSYVRVS
ncbi:MAG TPA: DUF1844 domain-containing protein [Candidatus Krumholzibacteriaceae bacterium]|nr:DUF1844 domain-containing protein [Candidatus Krumholzibacteriaceae bacterium]